VGFGLVGGGGWLFCCGGGFFFGWFFRLFGGCFVWGGGFGGLWFWGEGGSFLGFGGGWVTRQPVTIGPITRRGGDHKECPPTRIQHASPAVLTKRDQGRPMGRETKGKFDGQFEERQTELKTLASRKWGEKKTSRTKELT